MASLEYPTGRRFDLRFLASITGLRPQTWLCVGSGYSREDFKALILSQGKGFVADAVTTPQELCLKVLDLPKDRVLNASAREELLRMLLAEKRIMATLGEMKKIRRQRNFVKTLDAAIQGGRLAFAHSQEEEVYLERLSQTLGEQPLRRELQAFSSAYEAWMEASEWWDLPLLLKRATKRLREEGWPTSVRRPGEILIASAQTPESLEREFWDVLRTQVEVNPLDLGPIEGTEAGSSDPHFSWQRWHTLDDAAEYFADQILSEGSVRTSNFDHHAILIPDIPGVRRSLRRALEMRGIPLAETRDPTQVKADETLKMGLLPLQVVGRNFERAKVISWLREWGTDALDQLPAWIGEIHSRGIRAGMRAYQGGVLEGLYPRLESLQQTLGGRKTCRELSEEHLKILRTQRDGIPRLAQSIPFFESIWKSLLDDQERIGQENRKAPLLYWMERLQSQLGEASPPVEPLKPREGVRLYRLQQAPVIAAQHVWLFGVPPRWLGGEGIGDLWFSERDREILSSEFALRSRIQVREERLRVLQGWLKSAQKLTVLEAEFDSGGRERESLLPGIKELGQYLQMELPGAPELRGAHPRTLQGYSAVRSTQPTQIQLVPLSPSVTGQPIELSATLVDRYSRCGFQALAFHRWKLKDVREPGTELWPDVRGTLLHDAVRILMLSRSSSGHFAVLPAEALEQAWRRQRPLGLIRTQRVENYVRARMVKVLEVFCEKEREYFIKSQTRAISLDDLTLRLRYPNFSLRGKPDRIDQNEQGLLIIDYKSAGTVPHGQEILENGYRLQLPFYAVAAAHQLQQEVLGVQFVELDPKGGRKSGILFQEFNGKEPGKLTQLRSNSKSLFSGSREDIWHNLEQELVRTAEAYVAGRFEARPRLTPASKECGSCRVGDLCGVKRRTE